MRKIVRAVMTAIVLCAAFGSAIVAEAQIGGGYKPVATDNAEVVEAADFAVDAQKEKEGGPISLVSIKHAERQVVQGTNFRLCLEVKMADEDDAGVEPQDVKVVVYRNLQKEFSLTSWQESDCGGDHSEENHASPTAAPVTSVYSSLSNCKTVSTGIESATQVCIGVGGYNLRLEYSDARESITVISPNGKKHPLEFWNVISNAFSHVGEKAEWRVTRKNGKNVPIALIVRFNASDNSGDTPKQVSYLAVAKITPQKVCVTDKIAPSSTANEEARRAADASAGKSCLEPPAENHYSPPVSVGGVYENFTVGKGSGDLEGMRVVLLAAGGAYRAIVQVAQGGAEDPQPEFVDAKVNGTRVEFTAGSEKYTGKVTAAGLTLKDSSGSHVLRRKPCASYFASAP